MLTALFTYNILYDTVVIRQFLPSLSQFRAQLRHGAHRWRDADDQLAGDVGVPERGSSGSRRAILSGSPAVEAGRMSRVRYGGGHVRAVDHAQISAPADALTT